MKTLQYNNQIIKIFENVTLKNGLKMETSDVIKCAKITHYFLYDSFKNDYKIEKEFRFERKKCIERYFSYIEAKEYCMQFIPKEINTLRKLLTYIRENKKTLDRRLPACPHEKYKNEWPGIGDFLSDRRIRRTIFRYSLETDKIQKRKADICYYVKNLLLSNGSANSILNEDKYKSFKRLVMILEKTDINLQQKLILEWIYELRYSIYKITTYRVTNFKRFLHYAQFKELFHDEMMNVVESVSNVKFTIKIMERMKSFDDWIINTMALEIKHKYVREKKNKKTQLEKKLHRNW